MRRILTMLAIGTMLIAGIPAFILAADEDLFDTKEAAVHLEKGISYLKNKKYDAAIKELDDAASINPDAESYYYLGYAYYMKGKTGDAESRKKSIECFDKAYELNPAFTPSRFKPMESGKTVPEPATEESTTRENVMPEHPASAEPAAQPQGNDNPSQPAPPAKATDMTKPVGN